MIYTLLALDLAQERAREADHLRLVHEAQAARARAVPPRRPSVTSSARTLIARPIRLVSDASHAFSEAACTAATRIEGRAG